MVDFKINSLNTVRFLAAFNVFYGHAITHMNIIMPRYLNDFVSFFNGVPLFFAISGFLIWRSVGNSNSFIDYSKKRFWRLYPELWVAVVVEIVVLLLLYDHYIDWGKLILFALGQGTLFQFWTPDFLRDYGCGCPNGALATIGVLIQFYIIFYFFHKYLRNSNTRKWIILILLFVGISLCTPIIETKLPLVVYKLYCQTFIPFFWLFLVGAFVSYKYDTFIPMIKNYWYLFILIALFFYLSGFDIKGLRYGVFSSIFVFVGMLGFAYRFPQLNIKKDITYAFFIYHMTVINAMIVLGYSSRPQYLIMSAILSIIISYISTETVGKYSMKMKKMKTSMK